MPMSKTRPNAVAGVPIVCVGCKKNITPEQERVDYFRKGYMTVAYHADCYTKAISAEPNSGA